MTTEEILKKAILNLSGISDVLKELYKKSPTQGDNPAATNTAILEKLEEVGADTAKEDTLSSVSSVINTINDMVDELRTTVSTLATSSSVTEAKEEIIGSIPDDYAKQGTDSDATNTAIKAELDNEINGLAPIKNTAYQALEKIKGLIATNPATKGDIESLRGDDSGVTVTLIDSKIGDTQELLDKINDGSIELDIPTDYVTAQDLLDAKKDIINSVGTRRIYVQEMSDTVATIYPNILYIWGEVDSLTITLADPIGDGSESAEYMFQFTSGTNPTTLEFTNEDLSVRGEVTTDSIISVSILNKSCVIA